jgi:hypothetical protein
LLRSSRNRASNTFNQTRNGRLKAGVKLEVLFCLLQP